MFSIVETGLDIIFAISVVGHFAKNLSHAYTKAVKTILKYFKRWKNQNIIYGQSTLTIKRYWNSDWASNKNSKKSTLSYIFMLNGSPVSWCSKR